MEHRSLGSTGVKVSPLCLGATMFGAWAKVGPRTIEQLESRLGAMESKPSADVLERIDRIVPPGGNVNPGDTGWDPPPPAGSSSRRR